MSDLIATSPKVFNRFQVKKNTIIYTQLVDFKNEEYHVAHAKSLEEENKLIQAGFQYVRYSHKDEVAIYKKPK